MYCGFCICFVSLCTLGVVYIFCGGLIGPRALYSFLCVIWLSYSIIIYVYLLIMLTWDKGTYECPIRARVTAYGVGS